METTGTDRKVPVEKLRWRMDPSRLPFDTTDGAEPLKEIIGQERGVEALRFGIGMNREGYNVFVTGSAGSGRLSTVERILEEIVSTMTDLPDDLCYVNNFKSPEAPVLLRFPAGQGSRFRNDVHGYLETLKKEIPQFFESQDYLSRKKEILDQYEAKSRSFFKDLDKKVREEGFALVDVQMGQMTRPDVVPLIDGNPTHMDQLEQMVEKGRFPKEEYEALQKKQAGLKEEIGQIFREIRVLQKEIQENVEKLDRYLFIKVASERMAPLREAYGNAKVGAYFDDMIEDMAGDMQAFMPRPQQVPGLPFVIPEGDTLQPYRVNLLVDNGHLEKPPILIESFPTYRNLYGSIERVMDRSGVWRTDFSRIKAGSFLRANGGFLVLNLLDAIMEPGVWAALKRSLKTEKMEIQTYDPFYMFTTTGIKPEPIDIAVKVVVISDPYLYALLFAHDEDVRKIFKVRADFDTVMDRTDDSIGKFISFLRLKTEQEGLRPLDRSAVAAVTEQAVRMAERQEKISTSFPAVTDLLREADYWAARENAPVIGEVHVDRAIESKIFRSNRIEERIQEMIDRGTLLIDVQGSVVGQVNGLAVFSMGDFTFGKPSRITAVTSMGKAGIINIEREADLSGNTHNKGVLILGGYLRNKYAQDKPLAMSASIAFEQSYGGVDGDSASSTEVYALLSSLSGVPLRQDLAVTGSVNQRGEVQAIGGVNEKIEGFFDCCRHPGLTGDQGVLIPESNVKDLMLRKDVVKAVEEGKFHIYSIRTIDEGIEILTGRPAGEKGPDGTYPEGSINDLADRKLRDLGERIQKFGEIQGNGEKSRKD
ncbi:MAG TPA: AAA family ATPase [Syntrophales bacterium]|nr:AAA family ATPase [Syntrophales bacterium]HPX12137.1 AAA family ATPase [Syntrophales bacterium]HQN76658.1 AAA family ATPase [Syntrophales bacterium]HQQ27763.1 AAA family ATPase [Syntrophales bacterium]